MRKNIDISDDAVKALSIQAIENGTNFKNYVENILEEIANEGLKKKIKKTSTNVKSKRSSSNGA